MSQTASITDAVVDTAERLEEYVSYHEIDHLERKYEVSEDATVREVTLVLGTGGPHIEVNCFSGTVHGYWGGESHTTHVVSRAVDNAGEIYADLFEDQHK